MAQHEEALAKAATRRGDTGLAFEHLYRAEQIKSGIGVLSEKEKMPEQAFKTAIDSSTVFVAIRASLEAIIENTGKNFLVNQ